MKSVDNISNILINIFFICIMLLTSNVKAIDLNFYNNKEDTIKNKSDYPKVSVGIGMGLDYGGIGGRLTSLAYKNLSLFVGFGYNLSDAGVNIGASLRLLPNKFICPTISGIYGYNAVILITGARNSKQTYYGGSLGFGFELRSKKLKNYLSFGFYIPFRSQTYEKDMRALRQNPNIKITKEPEDAIVTLGYHFII